jgi:IS30 family transposase
MMELLNTSSSRSNAVMKYYTTIHQKCYTHFSGDEREEIAVGLEQGKSLREIAANLARSPSSVSREIRRNTPSVRNVRYRGNRAHRRAAERSRHSHARDRLANPVVRAYVECRLVNDGWTPQEIAGRLPIDKPGLSTNYESIYQWIYQERRDLIKYLPRAHKKRRKRPYGKKKNRLKIPNRVDITERPAHIEGRRQAGHWEVDTVVSRQSGVCVAVLVERKSRFYIVIRIKDKSARSMRRALEKALGRLPSGLRRSITYDNGLENVLHELTNKVLGTKSYFCKPYHSWEKGSIENRNGILRRYFPKKHDWALTSQKEINKVAGRINSTPMKCLGYRTPAELFAGFSGVALTG